MANVSTWGLQTVKMSVYLIQLDTFGFFSLGFIYLSLLLAESHCAALVGLELGI